MYEYETNFEDALAREQEMKAKCSHSYLKCGFCGVVRDNLNNEYRLEIDRLRQLLITHGISPENVILR